jgi:hypothetical protein
VYFTADITLPDKIQKASLKRLYLLTATPTAFAQFLPHRNLLQTALGKGNKRNLFTEITLLSGHINTDIFKYILL